MKQKSVTSIAGTLVIVALATFAIYGMMFKVPASGPSIAMAADKAKAEGSEQAVSVEVTQPVRRELSRTLRMPATLLPGEMADLYAKVSGYIASVKVDIGSKVKKGDVLLTIDVPEMADELRHAEAVLAAKKAKVQALGAKVAQADSLIATAKANLQRNAAEQELSKITLDRQEKLHQQKAIPEQAFDEAKSKFAIAEAQLRIAQANVASAEAEKQSVEADAKVAAAEATGAGADLGRLRTLANYATIKAPFDGVITDRLMDTGAFVRSASEGTTMPILRIAIVDRLRLALDIPESDVASVAVGTKVDMAIGALGGEVIQAAVNRMAGAIKVETRTMRAEVDLEHKDGRLSPGMYARVTINLQTKAQALLVPSKAIRVRGREVSVLVADGGVAKSMVVKIGYDDGIWTEIVDGLAGDERVIVAANSVVAPGAAIKATPVRSTNS